MGKYKHKQQSQRVSLICTITIVEEFDSGYDVARLVFLLNSLA